MVSGALHSDALLSSTLHLHSSNFFNFHLQQPLSGPLNKAFEPFDTMEAFTSISSTDKLTHPACPKMETVLGIDSVERANRPGNLNRSEFVGGPEHAGNSEHGQAVERHDDGPLLSPDSTYVPSNASAYSPEYSKYSPRKVPRHLPDSLRLRSTSAAFQSPMPSPGVGEQIADSIFAAMY